MLVTLFGIVMLCKLEQPRNVQASIFVTLFGIVILFKLLQTLNVPSLISVMP